MHTLRAQINRGNHKNLPRQIPPGNCYGKRAREMATADPEFLAYMRTQNFTADQATDVAEKLSSSGLHRASGFLGFYSTKGTDMYR